MTSTKRIPVTDLTIVSMACAPEKPPAGGNINLNIVIKNQGTGGAGASAAAIYLDSFLISTPYVSGLDAGATTTLSVPISLAGLAFKSMYKIKAEADCNNTVFETDELNNTKEISVSPVAPDLEIQAVKWSPEKPVTGEPVTFSVTVKNSGDDRSGSANVSYYVDSAAMGQHLIEGLEPGAAVTRSFTWTPQKVPFVFNVIIDEANTLNERDESNNSRSVTLAGAGPLYRCGHLVVGKAGRIHAR